MMDAIGQAMECWLCEAFWEPDEPSWIDRLWKWLH